MMHRSLLKSHNELVVTFSNNNKRSCIDDQGHVPSPSNTLPLQALVAANKGTTSFTYSRSEYPQIQYWTRQEWRVIENMKKDSSEVAGPCGGTRLAQGENVNMQFIEYANGTPVSGTLAHDIRSFAKSIWQGFYNRGMTPETWGSMSRAVEDEYICKMETKWPMLCYCDNHWKVNFLATQTYSQWYCQYDDKMKKLKANAAKPGGDKPAVKKHRITTEEPNSEPSPLLKCKTV